MTLARWKGMIVWGKARIGNRKKSRNQYGDRLGIRDPKGVYGKRFRIPFEEVYKKV